MTVNVEINISKGIRDCKLKDVRNNMLADDNSTDSETEIVRSGGMRKLLINGTGERILSLLTLTFNVDDEDGK
jgi:hypothetical protein